MTVFSPARVPAVVFGLCLFWGGVLAAFFWTTGFNFLFLLPWIAAILVGAWVAQVRSDEVRKAALSKLRYSRQALPVSHSEAFRNEAWGVVSSLGPVPLHQLPLQRLQSYTFDDLKAHCPVELQQGDLFERLIGPHLGQTARQRHGQHLAVFDALACVMLHPHCLPTPAGVDMHGGRSLLTHTLLVFALMAQRVYSYIYMPGHGRLAIDINFKLDPLDPLIPIVAMTHDLGKIRKMVCPEGSGRLILLPGHDSQAARDMAQVLELWAPEIDPEDRRIVLTLLAYYGRVADMPVRKMKAGERPVVTSDRMHALVGLLAECDRLASAIELGAAYQFDAPAVTIEVQAPVEEVVEPVNLFHSLAKFFVMAMPVNARSPVRSVGFKRKDPDFSKNRDVVIIDELEFVKAFASFLGKPELSAREGKSSALTKLVLELLDERGFLFRFDEGSGVALRPATSCLYKIAFRNADAPPDAEPTLLLSSAFLVDVTEWPNMAKLQGYPNCLSVPSFAGFRLGRQPGAVRRSAHDVIAAQSLGSVENGAGAEAVGVDVTRLVTSKRSKPANPARQIQKIGRALFAKTIGVAASDEAALAVVGADTFFEGIGIKIEAYERLPEALQQVGILQIKKSVRNPDAHVVHLSRSVYDKFMVPTMAPQGLI